MFLYGTIIELGEWVGLLDSSSRFNSCFDKKTLGYSSILHIFKLKSGMLAFMNSYNVVYYSSILIHHKEDFPKVY